MYFKKISCFFLIALLFPFKTFAQITVEAAEHFAVTPNKCVALREGRPCYALVSVNWKKTSVGNYCLRYSKSKQLLQCWTAQSSGVYQYEFDGSTLPSGAYFYHLNTASGETLTRKMMLIK